MGRHSPRAKAKPGLESNSSVGLGYGGLRKKDAHKDAIAVALATLRISMEALDSEGVEELSVWRIHRKIGMSGGLFTNHFKRESGVEMARTGSSACGCKHARACRRMSIHIRPLPGGRAARVAKQRRPPMDLPPAGEWRRQRSTSTRLASIRRIGRS
jgi:hypothetical protein